MDYHKLSPVEERRLWQQSTSQISVCTCPICESQREREAIKAYEDSLTKRDYGFELSIFIIIICFLAMVVIGFILS